MTTSGFGPSGLRGYHQSARECEPATICNRCNDGDHDDCTGHAWTVEGLPDGCVCRYDNGCGEVA